MSDTTSSESSYDGSLYLELGGKILDSSMIGWVSSIKARLLYCHVLVAKARVRDTPLILDNQNNVKIEWDDETGPKMKIKDMRFFKTFIEHVMPAEGISNPTSGRKRTVADVSISSTGHNLTISIYLDHMARMRATAKNIEIAGNEIFMIIEIINLSPFSLCFDNARFDLKRGDEIIGHLAGDLKIVPGVFKVDLAGSIYNRVSGMATLKGDEFHEVKNSWQYYAIKLFQIEVNLDEAVVDNE
ncbi:hypothetical protein TARUN_1248 [Trichoderma arundinaceum]|uniref:Uncharacterized protein n=1 Tax=Trichoderma arundinaceum TaxID=490622 RepID=A0A395NY67_TRIAR|nr:hypothetical protein TARUN_1248 [Trichoderma arundinaceum]